MNLTTIFGSYSWLQLVVIAAGAVLFVAGVVLLAYVLLTLRRRSRFGHEPPARASQTDLANMMMLLQTMRDLVEQQKQLARQLNESLDNKVAFIKETVDSALTDLDTLRGSVQHVAEHIQQAKKDIAQIHDQSRHVKLAMYKQSLAGDKDSPETTKTTGTTKAETTQKPPPSLPQEPPQLQVLAKPNRPKSTKNSLDNWVGLDFGGDEPDPQAFEVPEEAPQTPADADTARQAFRTLLDLEEEDDKRAQERLDSKSEGNGKQLGPLQARVYEYRDAGMTIAQIAKELGIGKGEARLILSLRKERT